MLRNPLKENPLQHPAAVPQDRKYQPPAGVNKFLGLDISVSSLPCVVAPTAERIANSLALIDRILAAGRLSSADAASTFGKLRFLGSALHGKCGLPALQPIAARQRECATHITPALRSALLWLRQLIPAVKPMEWTWGLQPTAPFPLSIFGDASEPGDGTPPRVGAVLLRPREAPRIFRRSSSLSCHRGKHICYYELLWLVLAA